MRSTFVTAIFAAALTGGAYACQPDPQPEIPSPQIGESQEAYSARVEAMRAEARALREQSWINQQQSWWDDSESVFIARVERVANVRLDFGEARRTYLRPVRWLKGGGPARRFFVNHEGWTSCGPYGRGGAAVEGAVGETFVVFVRDGRPSLNNLITSVAPSVITHPELRALLAAERH
jgi:hypothetical protein